jgi:para-aminobenzoate synthetase/4-amino-4-deoxychorismate lyase
MTSTVTARSDAPLADILAAAFPCASITGAPKVRTMRLLRELEEEPRGVYTGAIGSIAPGRRARFNVAIRTAIIDREHGRATYGVGSGIVWDSDAAAEYDECLLKARVLAAHAGAEGDFALLESLRWTPEEGYFLLARHIERLAGAAEYFSFPFDRTAVEQALTERVAGLNGLSKVRLLFHRAGRIDVEDTPIPPAAAAPLRVALAREAISSTDVRLYHKTTRREPYEIARAGRPDADEVILWNEHGEVTELAASNLVVELDGQLVTPPVSSTLLAGTLRAEMLAQGQIMERVVTLDDLARATGLWAINSVRGKRTIVLLKSPEILEPS